jgi:serine/threonine protein kinase
LRPHQKYETFGKYLLLDKIASGGMAAVYLAKAMNETGISKFVALKRMLPKHTQDANFQKMFQDEARIAIHLNHGNIVSIHEFGIENEQFFLVMDFVDGMNIKSLKQHLKNVGGKLTIEQILYIIREAARGLHAAHSCLDSSTGKLLQICHRDVTPHNIMVSYDGEVKVIDFGIAKAQNRVEKTEAGVFKGKVAYMSPEQVEESPVDHRTDIFSLGVVLWELLTETKLFKGESKYQIFEKVREAAIPLIREVNPTVTPELEQIVVKALRKSPSQRYVTAAEFENQITLYLQKHYPTFTSSQFVDQIKEMLSLESKESKRRRVKHAQTVTEITRLKNLKEATKIQAAPSVSKVPSSHYNIFGFKVKYPERIAFAAFATTLILPMMIYRTLTHREAPAVTSVVYQREVAPVLPATPEPQAPQTYQMPAPQRLPAQQIQVSNPGLVSKNIPKSDKRSLNIISRPEMAEIWIDNKRSGKRTPAAVQVPRGRTVQIRLRKRGYLDDVILTDAGAKDLTLTSRLTEKRQKKK